ncbi:MAG: ACP phosphodiesterase [Rudaea sp.]
MNHLAHVLLAGPRPQARLGAMLGDFWRGAPDPSWSHDVDAGVRLHRKIDVYTDSHPIVADARRLFDPPLRRYAGILIDVYFDHALARDWSNYADEPLAGLSAGVISQLASSAAWLPTDLNRFATYMRRHGLFAAYAQRAVIVQVLAGIGARLRHENPLAAAEPALWRHATALDAAFVGFFADLRAESARLRARFGID